MSEAESSTPETSQTDSLDLSSLRMMPAWVADFGKEDKIIERYGDREDRQQRGDRGERRGNGFAGDRRGGGSGERRFGGGGGTGQRRDGPGSPPRGDRRDGPGGPRRFSDRGHRREGEIGRAHV